MQSRTTKALIGMLAVVAVAVAGGFVLKAVWNTAKSHLIVDDCTVGDFTLDTNQAAVASTMVGAVTKYRVQLPERATVLVLAAGLQESKLRNLLQGEGDRDSVGVLQQRPSQDWGKVAGQPDSLADRARRLNDVGEATKEFLDALMKVPNWRTRPLADAIQAVQRSADGSLYAQHEVEAQQLADALQGVKPAGITCRFEKPTKVADASVVAEQASFQLGIDTPRAVGLRTVRVPGAHWQTVAWFVANANRLGIEQVAYAGRLWTRSDGWKQSPASPATVVATMYDLKA